MEELQTKKMVLTFTSYTGLDILNNLLPKMWQTKIVAKRLLKTMKQLGGGIIPDCQKSYLIVQMPWGSFRIKDIKGNIEPCPHESVPKI